MTPASAYSPLVSAGLAWLVFFCVTAAVGIAGHWVGKRIPGVATVIVIVVAFIAVGVAFEPLRRWADHEYEDDDLGGFALPITVAWFVLAASLGLAIGGVRAARRRPVGQDSL